MGENEPTVRELNWFGRRWLAVKSWCIWQRRKLPYLVWWNDELDVTITFSQDTLNQDGGVEQLWRGAFADLERGFQGLGITFDTGIGFSGRDWEWDWSLRGPVSIRFRSRAQKPWLRKERSRPKLVINNSGNAA